jgi:acyl-CoA hydrolase
MPSVPPPKHAEVSETTMTEYVLPTHANALGNVFGGQVLAWMDLCAAICAQRHAGRICVTAGIDELSFEQPIRIGEVVKLSAVVTAAFRTSLEILVEVRGEDATTGRTWPCCSAFLSFVARGEDGRPVAVPPLEIRTSAEASRFEAAEARRARRLAHRKAEPPASLRGSR